MASYGEGVPTDNAKSFMDSIQKAEKEKQSFKACNYSVFGLGNSQCFPDRYNVVAKKLDRYMKSLGGNQVVELELGDASGEISEAYEIWKEKILSTLKSGNHGLNNNMPSPTRSTSEPGDDIMFGESHNQKETGENDRPTLSSRQMSLIPSDRLALSSVVLSSTEHFLSTDEFTSAKSITFSLSNSNCDIYDPTSKESSDKALTLTDYVKNLRAGDHVGVFSPNSSLVIRRFIANMNLPENSLNLSFDNSTTSDNATLYDVLKWQVQLSGVVPITTLKILLRWANSLNSAQSALYLSDLISNYDDKVRKRGLGIASVLAGVYVPYSLQSEPPPLKAVVKSLPIISPRLYSIVNDPENSRDYATVLCRLLRYRDTSSGSLVSGLCSSYLCERLGPMDKALIYFRESNFHLPADPGLPIIMICGGSGIAPFLSFLDYRANYIKQNKSSSLGPAVPYYGCRNPNEYMFRSELQQHLRIGSLSDLFVAFSDAADDDTNDSADDILFEEACSERCNITDLVNMDSKGSLREYMRSGAHIYVCGGAGRFGGAVRNSVELLAQSSISDLVNAMETDHSSSSARGKGVRYLVNNKRYFEDLAD